jgi:hypothetical protein
VSASGGHERENKGRVGREDRTRRTDTTGHEDTNERRRRLAAALDDALPDRTRDEDAESWGDKPTARGGAGDEDWLRGEVPPHHG